MYRDPRSGIGAATHGSASGNSTSRVPHYPSTHRELYGPMMPLAFHRPLAISVAGLMLPALGWRSPQWASPSRTATQVKQWPTFRLRSP